MDVFETVNEFFEEYFGVRMKEKGRLIINQLVDEYGADEVIISAEISCSTYGDNITALQKLKGILYNRNRLSGFFYEVQ